jgi:hypothetical protein
MQAPILAPRTVERVHDGLHLAKLVGFDGLVDSHNVLPDDSASADVQMPDLAVAH